MVHTPWLGPTMSHCPSICKNWLARPLDSSAAWLRSEGIGNGINEPFASKIAHGMQRRFAFIAELCPSRMIARTSTGYMRTIIGVHLLPSQSFWRKEFRTVGFASRFVSNRCFQFELFFYYWMVGGSSKFGCCWFFFHKQGPFIGIRHFHPSMIRWCMMHVVHLGLLFVCNGSGMILASF